MLAICLVCDRQIEIQKRRGRKRVVCSDECRAERKRQLSRLRATGSTEIKLRLVVNGECSVCHTEFPTRNPWVAKYCSTACSYRGHTEHKKRTSDDRCGVYFGECPDCRKLLTYRFAGAVGSKPCKDCRSIRNRKINARKNHARRGLGKLDISIYELADRDGERCNICRRKINLTLSGADPMGPTIDHLLPISMGGTNDPLNLALAHRKCNTSRNNRGPAQLLLEVVDAGSSS